MNVCNLPPSLPPPFLSLSLSFSPYLSSTQIRRILGQVIIAMAHHHYLSLEGGQLMVEFVVRQSALNVEDKVGHAVVYLDYTCVHVST